MIPQHTVDFLLSRNTLTEENMKPVYRLPAPLRTLYALYWFIRSFIRLFTRLITSRPNSTYYYWLIITTLAASPTPCRVQDRHTGVQGTERIRHLHTWSTIATWSAMTFADYVQLSPSRVRYQGQGQGSVIDGSQSPAHESGTFCLLRCERLKTTNSSKSC